MAEADSRHVSDPVDLLARLAILEQDLRTQARGKAHASHAEVRDWADRLAWIRGQLETPPQSRTK